MTSNLMAPTAANRPVRQRKSVTLYSDDNPSTFTVKRKRGQIDDGVDDGTLSETLTSSRSNKRGGLSSEPIADRPSSTRGARGRPKKSTGASVGRPGRSTSRGSGRGPGRPPSKATSNTTPQVPPVLTNATTSSLPSSKRRRSSLSSLDSKTSATNDIHTTQTSTSTSPNKRRGRPPSKLLSSRRKMILKAVESKPVEQKGTILPHAVTVQPILPLDVFDQQVSFTSQDDPDHSDGRRRPNSASGSVSTPELLSTYQFHSTLPPSLLLPSARPLRLCTRLNTTTHEQLTIDPPITCMATRVCDEDDSQSPQLDSNVLLAMGDASGTVTLYRVIPVVQSLQRLHTVASEQEAKRTINSKTVIRYPNSVLATAWKNDCVVILTNQQMECFDVVNPGDSSSQQNQLWKLPVTSATQPTAAAGQVQLEWKTQEGPSSYSLLWTTAGGPVPVPPTKRRTKNGADRVGSSGLYLLEFGTTTKKGVSCSEISPYPDCTVLTALWDNKPKSKSSTMVAVVYRHEGDNDAASKVELIRYNVDKQIIVSSVELDHVNASRHSASQWECYLQKYKDLIFLSSSKGIRVYSSTDDLSCLNVYGDSVALHGKTLHWQSCLWVKSPKHHPKDVCRGKKHAWLYREDELVRRSEQANDDKQDEYLLVGVPHAFREPRELQSTLYVWQPGQASPVTTLQAPEGGLLGCHLSTDASGMWRLLCVAAETGQAFEYKASLRSDFAGIQYPVGYKVIDDNVEYIEDEDELDKPVVAVEEDDSNEKEGGLKSNQIVADPDLEEALRRSLMDAKVTEDEEAEDVTVVSEHDWETKRHEVPCRPNVLIGHDSDEATPGSPNGKESPPRRPGDFEFLHLFPQQKAVREEFSRYREQQMTLQNELKSAAPSEPAASGGSALSVKPRGKRTRTANIEAMLQTTIDPELRAYMTARNRRWTNGLGSTLSPEVARSARKQRSPESKSKQVEADSSTDADVASSQAESQGEDGSVLKSPASIQRRKNALFLDTTKSASPPHQTGAIRKEQLEARTGRDGSDRRSPSIASGVSAEEKEVALELLLLSPSGDKRNSFTEEEKREEEVKELAAPPTSETGEESEQIVTPSDASPAHVQSNETANPETKENITENASSLVSCPACEGRMVFHRCGKREQPIDYEAIERAEREKKEREEEEKVRRRMERRRLAEARRREAKRQKKAEEERKRREEEERMRVLESKSFEEAHIREPEEDPVSGGHRIAKGYSWQRDSFQPAFSPVQAGSARKSPSLQDSDPSQSRSQSATDFSQDSGFGQSGVAHSQAPAEAKATIEPATGSLERASSPHVVRDTPVFAADVGNGYRSPHAMDSTGAQSSVFAGVQSHVAQKSEVGALSDTARTEDRSINTGYKASPASSQDDQVQVSNSHHTSTLSHQDSDYSTRRLGTFNIKVNGTELEPSDTLSTADALEALAGLANSLPAVTTSSRPSHNFSPGYTNGNYWNSSSWNGTQYDAQGNPHQAPQGDGASANTARGDGAGSSEYVSHSNDGSR